MYPETLFVIGGYSVNPYRLIILVGIAALLPIALRLGQARNIPRPVVLFGWAIAVASALIGGYAMPYVAHSYDTALPYSWSLGAIMAAVLSTSTYLLWLRSRMANPRQALDVLAPCIAFSFALGRLACFADGCCNGKPAQGLPWAVTFTNLATKSSYRNIPVHPTQLYESAGSLLILILLLSLFNRPNLKGMLIWIFFVTYGALRFANEFFRGDVRTMIGDLSLNQWVCLAAILIGGAVVLTRFATAHLRRTALAV